jgi:hypothetical protein
MKLCVAAVLALGLHATCGAATVQLSLSPSFSAVATGTTLSVDLLGTYDGSGNVLGGAVDLSFDAQLLQLASVTLVALHDVAGTTGSLTTNGRQGMLHGLSFATFDGVHGTFKIGTVDFIALASTGLSELVLSDAADPVFVWANEAAEKVTVLEAHGSVLVGQVPEPSTAGMLAVGLVPLFGLWQRRSSTNRFICRFGPRTAARRALLAPSPLTPLRSVGRSARTAGFRVYKAASSFGVHG